MVGKSWRGVWAHQPERAIAMIYFIQAAGIGHIKIGYTDADDALIRLASLQIGSPVPLKLLGTIPGSLEDEKDLHRRFGSARVTGEWFKPVAELLALVPSSEPLICGDAEVIERSVSIRVLTVGRKQFSRSLLNQLPCANHIDWRGVLAWASQGLPTLPNRGLWPEEKAAFVAALDAAAEQTDLAKWCHGEAWGWVAVADPNDASRRCIVFAQDDSLFVHGDSDVYCIGKDEAQQSLFRRLYPKRKLLPGYRPIDQLFIGV